jgi:hypothetical protein
MPTVTRASMPSAPPEVSDPIVSYLALNAGTTFV